MESKRGRTAAGVTRGRARAWCLCVASSLLVSAVALAHPEVDAARAAYMEGDFVGALSRLETAERSPSATESDRVNIHWYRAASFHALGRAQDSVVAMDALLALRPMFAPSRGEAPPDLRAVLAERQRIYQEAHGVTLGAPELLGPGIRVPVLGHVENVGRVVAFVRVAPETDYTPVTLQLADTVAEGELPTLALWQRAGQQGSVEMVLEAYNARSALAARQGDALKPLVVPVTSEMAERAQAQLQPNILTTVPPAPIPAPPVTTERAPPAGVSPSTGTPSPYRFGFPPWFFMLLTTGVTTACASASFGGCTTFALLGVGVALASDGAPNNVAGGVIALSGLMTGLTLLLTSGLCCAALPLSGCTGILWIADFFYVGPKGQPARPAAESDEELP